VQIRRVLLEIGAEEQLQPMLDLLRRLGGDELRIDLFCGLHLAEALSKCVGTGAVLLRDSRRRALPAQLMAVRRGRYDLVVTQAGMEPRGAIDMAGHASMVHHDGELWEAPHRPLLGLLATLAAPPVATLLAHLSYRRFARPPSPGKPPPEAQMLLGRLRDVG
jgi:hypothetical protein